MNFLILTVVVVAIVLSANNSFKEISNIAAYIFLGVLGFVYIKIIFVDLYYILFVY